MNKLGSPLWIFVVVIALGYRKGDRPCAVHKRHDLISHYVYVFKYVYAACVCVCVNYWGHVLFCCSLFIFIFFFDDFDIQSLLFDNDNDDDERT